MSSLYWILPAAVVLDLVLGDPVYPYHPVRLIGRLAAWLETRLRRAGHDGVDGGFVLWAETVCLSGLAYWAVRAIAGWMHAAAAATVDLFVVYSCIALRDLLRHAHPVADALEQNRLDDARAAVSRLVGRDVTILDEAGVARAAVESVAEGFPDGFLAPVFWFALVGAATGSPALAVLAVLGYRATNTLDSMVGYRNERYEQFGKVAARMDDALNFVPARLSLPFLYAAANIAGFDARAGWRIALRDRLKHESPNSAHAESFVAGALGIRLGGPTVYPDGTVDKPWLGDGTDPARPRHVRAACRLVFDAACLAALIASLTVWIVTPNWALSP